MAKEFAAIRRKQAKLKNVFFMVQGLVVNTSIVESNVYVLVKHFREIRMAGGR
jgi:hypothetical protein